MNRECASLYNVLMMAIIGNKIEIESFEQSLGSISNEGVEDDSGSSSEESILKQIRKK